MSRQSACDACRKLLGAWSDQALEGAERARVEAHVAECAACQAEMAALGTVDRALSSLEVPGAPDGDWSAVAARAWARVEAEAESPVAAGMESGTGERPGHGLHQADWRERMRAWLGLEGPWWRGLAPVMGVFLIAMLSWQVWTGRPDGTGTPAGGPEVAPAPRRQQVPISSDGPGALDAVLDEAEAPGWRLGRVDSEDAAQPAAAGVADDEPPRVAKSNERIQPTASLERRSTPGSSAGVAWRKGATFSAFKPPSDEVSEESIADQVSEESIADQVTEESIADEVTEESIADEVTEEVAALSLASPVSPSRTDKVELEVSAPAPPRPLAKSFYSSGRGASELKRTLSVTPIEWDANQLGFLLEGSAPADLIGSRLGAGPPTTELLDAADLLRAAEHADATALLDALLAAKPEQYIVTLSYPAVQGSGVEADRGSREEMVERPSAGVTALDDDRADARAAADGTLHIRARARYLLLVAGSGAGSPDDLAGLRRRLAETEQVAIEFARLTEGRAARLWSAEIAYRIWTLTGSSEDCRVAERHLRDGLARLASDPALTRHLGTLLNRLDC